MSLVISKLTHINMSNHFYTFNNKLFKQTKGGAIVSELTGEVSGLYMVLWDQKFLKKLKGLGIVPRLYVRYVDDTLIITEVIKPGVRYVKGKFVWSEVSYKEDIKLNEDDWVFRLLQTIADSIDGDIQWEADTCSRHVDGKLPCLDLKLWMVNGKKCLCEFYKKPMSSKHTVLARSALSDQTKRSTIFMESYRRVINCSPDLPWVEKARHLTQFAHTMMNSGYNHAFRHRIIHGTIERYNQMKEMVQNGDKIWFRSRDQILSEQTGQGWQFKCHLASQR